MRAAMRPRAEAAAEATKATKAAAELEGAKAEATARAEADYYAAKHRPTVEKAMTDAINAVMLSMPEDPVAGLRVHFAEELAAENVKLCPTAGQKAGGGESPCHPTITGS